MAEREREGGRERREGKGGGGEGRGGEGKRKEGKRKEGKRKKRKEKKRKEKKRKEKRRATIWFPLSEGWRRKCSFNRARLECCTSTETSQSWTEFHIYWVNIHSQCAWHWEPGEWM